MKTEPEIDALMAQLPERVRRRWCESRACACMGCVQTSNRVMMAEATIAKIGLRAYSGDAMVPPEIRERLTITRDEWENWKARHPNS